MKFFVFASIVVVVSYGSVFSERTNALKTCTYCHGLECDYTSTKCDYGQYRDFCGQMKCRSGPNQTCGGLFNDLGKCGEGMECECNYCSGCSTDTLECYKNLACNPYDRNASNTLRNPNNNANNNRLDNEPTNQYDRPTSYASRTVRYPYARILNVP